MLAAFFRPLQNNAAQNYLQRIYRLRQAHKMQSKLRELKRRGLYPLHSLAWKIRCEQFAFQRKRVCRVARKTQRTLPKFNFKQTLN